MKKVIVFAFCAVFLPISGLLNAQTPGSLDPSFATAGQLIVDADMLDVWNDIAVQADQKIVAAGMSFDAAYVSTAYVHRFLPDGSPDLSFGQNGKFTYNLDFEANLYACAIKPDGHILISGSTTDYQGYRILLIQLLPDGTPDPDFGDNGVALLEVGIYEDHAYGMALLETGEILLSGIGTVDYAGEWRFAPMVVKCTASGELDTSFGDNGVARLPVNYIENTFRCIAVQPDGKILAAGHYANDLLSFAMLVARFLPNGALDPDFAEGGIFNYPLNADAQGFDIALDGTGHIFVAGVTVTPDYDFTMLLMKLNPGGEPVSDFGTDGIVNVNNSGNYDVGYSLKIQDDGKIMVAGTTGNGPPEDGHLAVWRFMPDGAADMGFGDNGSTIIYLGNRQDEIYDLEWHENGRLLAAGKTRNDINTDFFLMRLYGDQATAVSTPSLRADISVSPNPTTADEAITLAFDMPVSGDMTIELFNMQGEWVCQWIEKGTLTGRQNIHLRLPAGLSAGVYQMAVRLPSGTPTMSVPILLR